MKPKSLSYQISLSFHSAGCQLLQRQIQSHHPSVWVANHFAYEKSPSSLPSLIHQLDWSESWFSEMPPGLKAHLDCLHRESQHQSLSLKFAVAIPAPHWFVTRVPVSLQGVSPLLHDNLKKYLRQLGDDDWVVDWQASDADDAQASSDNAIIKSDSLDLLVCCARMVSALKNWLSPFGWQWSLMDMDFACFLRVFDFFCATQINAFNKTMLLCMHDDNQMNFYLWKNQRFIFFANPKKNSESFHDWMQMFKSYLSIFLEQGQIDVILFSGQMIPMQDRDHLKLENRDIFYLDDMLPFSSTYLFNMGLLFKSGWTDETI